MEEDLHELDLATKTRLTEIKNVTFDPALCGNFTEEYKQVKDIPTINQISS